MLTPAIGLVGHWRFDEGRGTTAHDSSGRDNHGTLVGGPRWVVGRIGGCALALDGEDDRVRLPNMRTVECYPFTFVAWIRTSCREDREMTAVIEENEANSGQRVQLCLSRSGEPKWNVRNRSAEAEIVHPIDIRDGGWHFLAGVSQAEDRHELYVDGAPVRKSSVRVPLFFPNSFSIGNWMGNRRHAKWFEGEIDEVRVYERALGAAEIEAIRGPLTEHRLTVHGGSGGGAYTVGTEVRVEAGPAPAGKTFGSWTGATVGLADAMAASTTIIMPARAPILGDTPVDRPPEVHLVERGRADALGWSRCGRLAERGPRRSLPAL